MGSLEQLAGVHQAFRIERALERSHELELEGVLVAADFVALELPQAMLGRDRAAEARHRVVDDPVHRFALRNQRSEEHTSELQSQSNLVCRLLLEKKKNKKCETLND